MPSKSFNATWVKSFTWDKASKETGKEAPQFDYFDSKPLADGIQLGMRVGKRHKTWFATYRNQDKKWKRYSLGKNTDELGYADARERAKKVVLDILGNRDPAREKQDNKKAPTFEYLASEYLEKESKVNKKSWDEDERRINKHLIPALGDIKAHDVRAEDIEDILDGIKASAPVEATQVYRLVRRMYNWALKHRGLRDSLDFNPCNKVASPSKPIQRDRVLNFDEIRRTWTAYDAQVDGSEGPEPLITSDMANVFKLMWLTAQREIEVLSMRQSDIDFDTSWWTIPAEVAKNKLPHRVPLSSQSIQVIQEQIEANKLLPKLVKQKRKLLKETTAPKKRERLEKQVEVISRQIENDYLFPSVSKEGHVTNVWKPHYRVRDKAKIKDFRPHDIRRTVASNITSEHIGKSRLVVSMLLNHKAKGITAVYDRHSYDSEKREALEAWARLLIQIIKDDGKVVPMVRQ